MFPYSFYRNNFASVNRAIQKLEKNELTLEDILDEDDLVLEVKTNPQTQLASFFNNEVIRKLIDYSTKIPSEDTLKIGHKYPFNACEILCSENSFIIDKIMENTKLANEDDDSDDSNIFKQKAKKHSEDQGSRKDSNNSNENNSDGNSEDNEIIFVKEDNHINEENKNQANNELDNSELKNKNKDLNDINDKENAKSDNDNKNENNEKESLNEKQNPVNEENEKNLLEQNKEDELNFANPPEEINNKETRGKENIENNNNSNNKSKENKKVLFSQDTEDYNEENEDPDFKSRNKKKSFHQKKRNLDNININMEKLISENKNEKNNENKENENNQDDSNDNNNEYNENNQEEEDAQEFLDLSQEKSKDESDSSLNKSIKSEIATYSFPNLDYLFEFLDKEDDDLNYVLSGYFFKIFNNMLNSKSSHLVKYVFKQNIHVFERLLNNVQRKSICDCLSKLLIINIDENVIPNGVELRINAIEKLFLKLKELDLEALSNVSEMIVECLKNKNFYFNFISESRIFEIINDLLINTNNYNNQINNLKNEEEFPNADKTELYKNLLKILNKLNENILKDFGTYLVTPILNDDTDSNIFSFQSINLDAGINGTIDDDLTNKKLDPAEIKVKLEKIYDILCKISYTIIEEYINSENDEKDNKMIITTYDNEKRTLGTKRLLSVEYIKNILDITINSFALSYNTRISQHIEKIVELNPFNLLLNHFFEFEFNSAYQKLFEQIIILISNLHTPNTLIDLLFKNCKFVEKFIDYSMNKFTFRYNSGKLINSGNFAACAEVISILMKTENLYLKEVIDEGKINLLFIKNKIESNFKKLYDIFYQPISSQYFKNLLYANKPAKTTYFDRINHFDETEFELDTPEIVEEPSSNPITLKSYIISCRDEFLYGKSTNKITNENRNIDENFNPLEYVSKGNLDEEDDRNLEGEMYVILNNDDIQNNENEGTKIEEENLYEIRNNGFIKNSFFNTDKEINISEINSELNNYRSSNVKDNSKENLRDEIRENDKYNDLLFWDNKIRTPTNLTFLDDL